jgi:hypothetical protein
MPLLKTKMSKSAYVLIAIAVIAVIGLVVAAMLGAVDLSFIGFALTDLSLWMALSPLNVVLVLGGFFLFGALFYYALKKYILGTQIPVAAGYIPTGQTVSPQAQQKDETVITQ